MGLEIDITIVLLFCQSLPYLFVFMAKNLRIRDKLLICGAVLGDAFFELGKSPHIRHKQAIGILPPDYKMSNFTVAVSRMLKVGQMEKVVKDGEPYLRLSGEGKRALVRDFPLLKLRERKWDGLWRVVFYDIDERQRGIRIALQNKLVRLGFGRLQKSVYVSPLSISGDLHEFLESRGLLDLVFVGACWKLLGRNEKELAAEVWHLSKLNERYRQVEQEIDDFLEGKSELVASQIYTEFEQILLDDPLLPKELLPDWWVGNEVIRKMKELLEQAG